VGVIRSADVIRRGAPDVCLRDHHTLVLTQRGVPEKTNEITATDHVLTKKGRREAAFLLRCMSLEMAHRDRSDPPESRSTSGSVADVVERAASVQSFANDP
jgi:hypothetical protein